MTDQERQLLQQLAARVQNAPPSHVDPEADDFIRRTIGARPDALYLLTQTVLIQEMALNQARASQPAPSFLGNAPGGYQGSSYQAPPPQAQYDPPPLPPQGGRFSNFLHNAATTAAGVVAGEVAFSALGSLFGGHGGGGFFSGGGGIYPGSETIVNNYYEGNPGGESSGRGFGGDTGGLSPDLEDRRFASGNDDSDYSDGNTADALEDDSSYDDGSDSSDL